MKPIYEEVNDGRGDGHIRATFDNGVIYLIPKDPANSDYQAYLKRDEPQVEHLTEIPTK